MSSRTKNNNNNKTNGWYLLYTRRFICVLVKPFGVSLDVGFDPGRKGGGCDAHAVDVGVLKASRLLIQELRHLETKNHARDMCAKYILGTGV